MLLPELQVDTVYKRLAICIPVKTVEFAASPHLRVMFAHAHGVMEGPIAKGGCYLVKQTHVLMGFA